MSSFPTDPRAAQRSTSCPSPGARRGWHLRGASSPANPVVLDGCSARGLLAQLEGCADEAAVSAREQLAAALKGGKPDAIRDAMDRARAVLPAPTMSRAEAVEAELAEVFASTHREPGAPAARTGSARAAYVRPPEPAPREVLAAYDEVLSGELTRSQRWGLEQTRTMLARLIEGDAKTLPERARAASRELDAFRAEAERRRQRDVSRASKPAAPEGLSQLARERA